MAISKGIRKFVKVRERFVKVVEVLIYKERNLRLQYSFPHLISLW